MTKTIGIILPIGIENLIDCLETPGLEQYFNPKRNVFDAIPVGDKPNAVGGKKFRSVYFIPYAGTEFDKPNQGLIRGKGLGAEQRQNRVKPD